MTTTAQQSGDLNVATLIEAVQAGDVARVRDILRARPVLVHTDTSESDEHRAIHHAVLRRDAEMVRILMDAGSDARKGIYPHRDATSAHTLAKDRGYDEILAIIEDEERHRREALSCPNATITPVQDRLHAAIRAGTMDDVTQVLGDDATLVKACDREGRSPLHVAAEALDEAMVALLLERGGDVKRKDAHGQTPLERAARVVEWRRQDSLAKFPTIAGLLRGRGAPVTPAIAVALGDGVGLRELHRHDPEAVRNPEAMLLTLAVNHEQPKMINLLIDLGAHPDEPRRVGGLEEQVMTTGEPLWRCAAAGKFELAKLLLERGASPNVEVYAGGSPLFQAYGARCQPIIDLLQAHGCRPDAITAGLYRLTPMGKELLAAGERAGVDAGHDSGNTTAEQMLWGAACGGDPELVRLCLERIDWPRDDPRWYGKLDQPLSLWNHGRSFWARNDMDRTTYLACFRLILARCDPNLTARCGRCMLHEVTAGRGHMTPQERVDFAAALLDAGARIDLRDRLLKSTPLGWACRWGHEPLVELFLIRGAAPDEPDAEPWATPLAWARKMNHPAIEARLRAAMAT